MTVLLTGASGYLGSHALASLRRRNYDVVVAGRHPPADPAVRFIAVDLLAKPDWPALLLEAGASHMLHLAWYAEHGRYWTSPLNLSWVDASVRLVDAFCAGGGRHVVVAGTCAEYDWSWGYCREDHTPLEPASLYGTAKDATRRLVTALCRQHGVPCAWGRIFLPYGGREAASRLVPSLIAAFRGKRPHFAINAAAHRDVLHVSDVAEALVALLAAKADGSFNIASGQPVALGDIARRLAAELRTDPEPLLALGGHRPGEPPLLVGDVRKLQALGWGPTITLDEGLARSVTEAAQ